MLSRLMADLAGWDRFFEMGLLAPRYLGLDLRAAEQLAASEGISLMRVADLDATPEIMLTLDFCSTRLTLVIREGKVVKAGFS